MEHFSLSDQVATDSHLPVYLYIDTCRYYILCSVGDEIWKFTVQLIAANLPQ